VKFRGDHFKPLKDAFEELSENHEEQFKKLYKKTNYET